MKRVLTMATNINEELLDKFPSILKEKIKNNEFAFPNGTLYDYSDREGYRMITRNYETIDITREDFRSFAEIEQTKKVRGKKHDTTKPEYFGTSLFNNIEVCKQVLKLPQPRKYIIRGLIFPNGGPILENNNHITWWLYENVDLSSFKLVENNTN